MSRSFWILPFYLAASLALTWPLARVFTSELPAVFGPADALLQVFLLGWGWEGFTSRPLEVFDAPIFYPEPRTLTYMDHMLGEALVAGPVAQIFGLAAGYNALVLCSFVLSGWFLYRLTRLYGVSRAGSCLAGFLFAFCPYRFSNLGELNQLQTQFIPLGLFFGARFLHSGRFRYGAWCALTLVVQSTFGWYGTYHLGTALALLWLWEAVREPGRWRRLPWKATAGLLAASLVLAAPGALPYWIQHRTMSEFRRSLGDAALWSADLLDYLRLTRENVLSRLIPGLGHDHGYAPGLVATVLAAVGILGLWRRWGNRGTFALLGLSGFLLSLGPVLQVAGRKLWIPLPFALCYFVIPGFSSMRAPGRFAALVALAVAFLAGVGFDRITRRHPRAGPLLYPLTLLSAGVLAWSPNLPFVAFPDRTSMPPVYAWLARQPGMQPLLEIPLPATPRDENATHARRQFYVLYHGKPRLDGVSGFTSPATDAFRRRMQSFPDPRALEEAYDLGARVLIVHYGDYDAARRGELEHRANAAPELVEIADFGDDVAYELRIREGSRRPD